MLHRVRDFWFAVVVLGLVGFRPVNASPRTAPPGPAFRGTILAADRTHGKLALVRGNGEILWEFKNPHDVHDLHRLPNGNILTHTSHQRVVEISPQGEIVWSYVSKPVPGGPGKVEVHAFQRLPNGDTMIAESGNARIIEVNRDGVIQKIVPLAIPQPQPHRDTRMVRKLKSGTYLVCHEALGEVREYDSQGKIVWSYRLELGGRAAKPGHGPEGYGVEVFGAIRLENGHTLIAGGNQHRVFEVTPEGKTVWSLEQNELPGITLAWVTTLAIGPRGEIILGNCHAGPDQPQLLAVTREKQLVWTWRNWTTFGNNTACAVVVSQD